MVRESLAAGPYAATSVDCYYHRGSFEGRNEGVATLERFAVGHCQSCVAGRTEDAWVPFSGLERLLLYPAESFAAVGAGDVVARGEG